MMQVDVLTPLWVALADSLAAAPRVMPEYAGYREAAERTQTDPQAQQVLLDWETGQARGLSRRRLSGRAGAPRSGGTSAPRHSDGARPYCGNGSFAACAAGIARIVVS